MYIDNFMESGFKGCNFNRMQYDIAYSFSLSRQMTINILQYAVK